MLKKGKRLANWRIKAFTINFDEIIDEDIKQTKQKKV